MADRRLLLLFTLMAVQLISAQRDTVSLKEVIIPDRQLRLFSDVRKIQVISDSVIKENKPLLATLLQYNTPIYFKENGFGMVASPSFRGTTAQQTAVIWNGISINSQLTGQADFNTFNAPDYGSISVRPGGGSVIYGSSAIGGSIHLNNDISFRKHFINELQTQYGSFNTFSGNYRLSASDSKTSANVSVSRNSSKNDYEYIGTRKRQFNENGEFYNSSMSASFGRRIGKHYLLKFYSALFDGERHFSGTTAAVGRSKYQNTDTRNLLEFSGVYANVTSTAKVAYITEKYRYFENAERNIASGSESKSVTGKYDMLWKIGKTMNLNIVSDVTRTSADGSDIDHHYRTIGSGALLFSHDLHKIGYELSVRKEAGDAYDSPVLFSAGIHYDPWKFYRIRANGSRNFRYPTFNDLYWIGSGNPDLKAERSYQAEIGQELKIAGISFSITAYYISVGDLIEWHPVLGVWMPENVASVTSYGAESILHFARKYGRHQFGTDGTFAYTHSEDDNTGAQLIYVPYYKATAGFVYGFGRLSAHYQYLYSGPVFTNSDHSDFLDGYQVSNAGAEFIFGHSTTYRIGFMTNNIFDEPYESVQNRPMPGRHYMAVLSVKF